MYDVIVVGGGPAGMTAALYSRRAGKSVLVCERETFGGQIALSPGIDNYPGVAHMRGDAFAEALLSQIREQGADTAFDDVRAVRRTDDHFTVEGQANSYEGRAVILATGAVPRPLGLAGERELIGRGVSYCALCDGAFFRGKRVAVVGGGNTALTEALYLSDLCETVYLIVRRHTFRADRPLVERVQARANVTCVMGYTVRDFQSEAGRLTGLRLASSEGEDTRELPLAGVFIAIGRLPAGEAIPGELARDDVGYAMVDETCATPLPGLFVAGDIRHKEVRQLTTAVGDGAVAAKAACTYLDMK